MCLLDVSTVLGLLAGKTGQFSAQSCMFMHATLLKRRGKNFEMGVNPASRSPLITSVAGSTPTQWDEAAANPAILNMTTPVLNHLIE